MISAAADSIENSLEQVRKQHQLTTSQFLVEIRMLHKRIDALEAAASMDEITRFATREELAERIRSTQAGQYCLVLIGARGLRRAEVQFGKEVGEELCAAFAKRLRNSLPLSAVIGRWGAEEFVAMLTVKKSEALASAKWITEHLSGSYACLKGGKTVRPAVQLTVGRGGNRRPTSSPNGSSTASARSWSVKATGLPKLAAASATCSTLYPRFSRMRTTPSGPTMWPAPTTTNAGSFPLRNCSAASAMCRLRSCSIDLANSTGSDGWLLG